ncbi:hypothetical protein JCM11491_006726 [Sporobolomyces phaffii]
METGLSRPLVAKPRTSITRSLRKHHRDPSIDSDYSSADEDEAIKSSGARGISGSTGAIILVLVLLLSIVSVAAVYFWHQNRNGSSSPATPIVKTTTVISSSSPKPTADASEPALDTNTHDTSTSHTRSRSTSKPTASSTDVTDESPPFSPTDNDAKPKPSSAASSSKSEGSANPAPTTQSSSSSSSSIIPQDLVDILLKTHNDFRALHQVEPLAWNETLAEASDRWVDNCVFEHSEGSLLEGGYGENLYAVSGTASKEDDPVDGKAGVDSWNDEIKYYTYDPPTGFTHETGHVTQTLWKDTKTVGCQFKNCKGVMKPGQWGGYLTCTYYPPGNYKGRFLENVLPPKGGD